MKRHIAINGLLWRTRQIIGYIVMGMSLVQSAALLNPAAAAERDRLAELYRWQFAASNESFAFLRDSAGFTPDLIVYKVSEKRVTIYRSHTLKLWSLSPNAPKEGGIFAIYWKQKTPDDLRSGKVPVMNLLRCANARCIPVFDFHGAIHSPIDFGHGKMLFVGGMSAIFHRPSTPDFVSFQKFDFYYHNGTGSIERLTEWEAAELAPISLGGSRLVFSFIPTPGKPTPQPVYPLTKSDIWSAAFTFEKSKPQVTFQGDHPFIQYGRNADTKPSISPDGSKTAFNSSSEFAAKEHRYDIVILDNSSKRALFTIAPERGTKLSYPVFVNDDLVRFMSFDGEKYSFRQLTLSQKKEDVVGQIAASDLGKAEVVEVNDKAGGE